MSPMFVTHFINTMFNANTRVQCGTSVPIWLRGTHPSVSDGIQTRQACANFETEDTSHIPCCAQAINIGVKNCNGFFVYFLHPPPICPVAYCAGICFAKASPSPCYNQTCLPSHFQREQLEQKAQGSGQ